MLLLSLGLLGSGYGMGGDRITVGNTDGDRMVAGSAAGDDVGDDEHHLPGCDAVIRHRDCGQHGSITGNNHVLQSI